jgi:predicted nucleic acid-binding Zn ribbon protein
VTREPRPLTDGLDAVLRSIGSAGSTQHVAGVFGRWADVVGPQVAAHATPVKLDGTTLVVRVDEPGWATQLRYLEATLVERLATVAGVTVERIEIRVHGERPGRRGRRD